MRPSSAHASYQDWGTGNKAIVSDVRNTKWFISEEMWYVIYILLDGVLTAAMAWTRLKYWHVKDQAGKRWVIDVSIGEEEEGLSPAFRQIKCLREGSSLPKVIRQLLRRITYTHTFHKCQVLFFSQVSAVPSLSIKYVHQPARLIFH